MPRDVAARALSVALARGAWVIALVTLATSIPILIDVFIDRGVASHLVVPLVCILAMSALVAYCGLRPSALSRAMYVTVGGVLTFAYTVAVLAADSSLNDDAQYLVNRLAFVLTLIVVPGVRVLPGVSWILGAFLATSAVIVAVSVTLGFAVRPGLGPLIATAVSLTCFLTVSLESRSRARTIPDLARLQAETRRLDVESQFEQRAAAIVHDTVLGDLAAVMHSNGVVDDRMRARFRADIATLADPSWLSDSATFEQHVPVDSELRLAISTLATEFQWRGLSVNTSGNYDGVVGVSREAAAALVFAIRACLENIVQHAQCDSADLVFDSSPDHVTAMVVDSGVGFNPQHVSPDRLGIRGSIVGRIEQHGGTVKVWSSPGSGTSVVIHLPAAEDSEGTND